GGPLAEGRAETHERHTVRSWSLERGRCRCRVRRKEQYNGRRLGNFVGGYCRVVRRWVDVSVDTVADRCGRVAQFRGRGYIDKRLKNIPRGEVFRMKLRHPRYGC